MTNIVILGGSIEGLILSILSAKQHNVTLIDIHPEIGFPCTIPGWVENLEVLEKYLSEDEIKQLNVFQNTNGFAISGEWLFKLLTIKAAQSGVNILLRCRVTNVIRSDANITVQYIGGNSGGEGEIYCDNLFDLTEFSAIAPGNLQHNHTKSSSPTNPRKKIQHFGGIALSKDCQNNPTEPILQLIRNDGLCELWYEEKPSWTPPSGWIEIMKNTSPKPINDMSIDNSITHAEYLFQSINHH
ncbi:MAG TPA: hypothetical protein EYQ58_07985 [Candidatus Poseidoniales archaeon]|nr:hypothetical protein [Candidatus Poseidoniales archaeon]